MIEVRQSLVYERWFAGLRDDQAKAPIDLRLRRVSLGNFGDVRAVGEGVSEIKIDYGPGYRVYFARRGAALIILLCGGHKGTQRRDIEAAKTLARQIEED